MYQAMSYGTVHFNRIARDERIPLRPAFRAILADAIDSGPRLRLVPAKRRPHTKQLEGFS